MEEIGFTGTQIGMNSTQEEILKNLIKDHFKHVLFVHHGDCIGADAQFHDIAIENGIKVCLHPPKNKSKRAFCKNASVIHPEKEYIERNHDIVDVCDILIGTPKENKEVLRSGTWATIRYGKKFGKLVIIILPNGEVEIINGKN